MSPLRVETRRKACSAHSATSEQSLAAASASVESTDAEASTRRRGRPRSESARRAVLRAAVQLLAARGYRALTMEGIAASAGVGKQTVYRWWPSKAAVVLTALAEHAEEDIPIPNTGDGRADLAQVLAATFAALRGADGPMLRVLMAEAQLDPAFAVAFRERLINRRRSALRALLARAQMCGELHPDADLDLLVDIAYGIMWYRLLLDHAPLSEIAARAVAGSVFAAGAAGGETNARTDSRRPQRQP